MKKKKKKAKLKRYGLSIIFFSSFTYLFAYIFSREYAIKKVAVGDNHPWLSRILREVTLLECLRHPNIVHYKHAWLESHQHSLFGPKVPFLFILMECAKGGNLEEYLHPELPLLSSALIKQKKWKQSYPRLPEAYYYTGIVMNEMSFLVRLLDTYQIMEMLK
ncbi:putative serine/threonine-protein kinase iks1, partial [Coelomomyces lativittatus]